MGFQEAEVLSVVAGLRKVLRNSIAEHAVSISEYDAVSRFVHHPDGFVGSKGISAVQLRNNPFGDYAPQSTQIQGILKGMYDAFTADLEKDNAEEAEKQKAFEEFMKTKKAEQATLELTLEKQEDAKAKKTKLLADSKTDRDDTKEQLAADEEFFEDTKTPARMWPAFGQNAPDCELKSCKASSRQSRS